MRVGIEIAPGELVDRITILQIKANKISDQTKLTHVINELDTLTKSSAHMQECLKAQGQSDKFHELNIHTDAIYKANERVWDVLQRQRELERAGEFGDEFVKVSLEVYHVNDERAEAKRKINELFGTDIAEMKFYPK